MNGFIEGADSRHGSKRAWQVTKPMEVLRMSDSDPAYIGVESCGCVTMAQVDRGERQKDVAKFVSDAVKAGCAVVRTTVGEAKAREHFLPAECPHDPKGWVRRSPAPPKPRTKIVGKWDGAWEATRGWFNYRAEGADDGSSERRGVRVLRPFRTLRDAIDALVPAEEDAADEGGCSHDT